MKLILQSNGVIRNQDKMLFGFFDKDNKTLETRDGQVFTCFSQSAALKMVFRIETGEKIIH